MTGAQGVLWFVAGLFFGSFGGILVDRVPTGIDVVWGRSRCDGCDRQLAWFELVPILSWIGRRGRCSACGSAITPLWTVLEVASGSLFWLAAGVGQGTVSSMVLALFFGALLVLAVIDIRWLLLPRAVIWPTFVGALLMILIDSLLGGYLDPLNGLLGLTIYGGVMALVYGVAYLYYGEAKGFGLGDVRLALLIGLVIGALDLASILVAIGAPIFLGGIIAIVALVFGAQRDTKIPFGTLMSLGALLAAVWGPQILTWYMSFYR